MRPSEILHRSLSINSAMSLATGLMLVIFTSDVAGWLGVSIEGWLRLFGVALIAHCGIVMFAGKQPSIAPWVKLNLAIIAPYPFLMAALVLTGIVEPATGQALVLLDGLLVGLVAIGQWVGLRGLRSPANPEFA